MVEYKNYGTLSDGTQSMLYTVTNKSGAYVSFLDLGATVVEIAVPDKDGNIENINLGYDTAREYEINRFFYGANIGRVANRIGNAEFKLGDKTYHLTKNDGDNNLHSAQDNFQYKKYTAEIVDDNTVKFTYVSKDGEGNFPGEMTAEITMSFDDDNELLIQYRAKSDKDTLCAMTNHSYFNLNGHNSGDILSHQVKINASYVAAIDNGILPTGEIINILDTAMDFKEYKEVGKDIDSDFEQLRLANGYDHCYILDKEQRGCYEFCASVRSEKSGRQLDVYSTKPAMQFYSGNNMLPDKGKDGADYKFRGGLCLEPQYIPNAMQRVIFPSPILKAGELYEHKIAYRFSVYK